MGNFILGFMFGTLVVLILHIYTMSSYKRILVLNSKRRSAEYINGEFYYIVSEREYNKSNLNK